MGLWLAVSAGVTAYLRFGREVTEVMIWDVALPLRWPHVRTRMGERYIVQAREALASRDFGAGLLRLRAGVARSPENLRARAELARLYVAFRRPDLARDVFLDRLSNRSGDSAYLRTALQFLNDFHYDAELSRACDALLADARIPDRSVPAFYAATIAFHRGNYDRAEALLRDYRLLDAPEGVLLAAKLDEERGYPEIALSRLTALLNQGVAWDECYVQLTRVYRQLGRTDELERLAAQRLAANPLSYFARLEFILLHHERGNTDARDRDVGRYFAHFAEEQEALLALGDFAANAGWVALAARIEEHFRTRDWAAEPAVLMKAEAHLASGNYAAGLEVLQNQLRNQSPATARALPVFDSLQAIALFGLNRPDEAALHLDRLLAQPNLRAENLHAIAQRLVQLGKPAQAKTVLARAVALDPHNQAAVSGLVRLQAQSGDWDELAIHTRQLLAMRRPSRATLEFVYRRLGTDLAVMHPAQPALLQEIEAVLTIAPGALN